MNESFLSVSFEFAILAHLIHSLECPNIYFVTIHEFPISIHLKLNICNELTKRINLSSYQSYSCKHAINKFEVKANASAV
jgi:hypothetical protein